MTRQVRQTRSYWARCAYLALLNFAWKTSISSSHIARRLEWFKLVMELDQNQPVQISGCVGRRDWCLPGKFWESEVCTPSSYLPCWQSSAGISWAGMVCCITNIVIAVQSVLSAAIYSSKQLESVIFKGPQTVAVLGANAPLSWKSLSSWIMLLAAN